MEILVVVSTLAEFQSVTNACDVSRVSENHLTYTLPDKAVSFDVLIGGVGIASTTFHLTRTLLASAPKVVIQAGIAGAYDRHLAIGQAVVVQEDQFATTGAEEEDTLLDVFDLGLQDPDHPPFHQGKLHITESALGSFRNLQTVRGITVDTTTGTTSTHNRRFSKYHPQIETMEGAACYYVCAQLGIPAVQIRTISNYVEKRNKLNWNIPLAVSALKQPLLEYIETYYR